MLELAGPVSDRVQIQHVILGESIARRRALSDGPPTELSLSVNVRTELKGDEHLIQVFPRFTLTGRDGPDGAEEVLRVEAMFVAVYRILNMDGIRRENIDAFGQINGIYNVWPYWREFVQSMTVRMGLPPLTVPVFRPLVGGMSREAHGETSAAERAKRERRGRGAAAKRAPGRKPTK
jgi:preprotein translocase subunit SecB